MATILEEMGGIKIWWFGVEIQEKQNGIVVKALIPNRPMQWKLCC